MNAVSASEILHTRFLSHKQKQYNDASIENTVTKAITNNTSIELPAEIKELITGSAYWVKAKTNRYKKLIREGELDKLLHLAREARTKGNPANWFAAACSKARWEKYTLPYFTKLKEVARKAENVARKLGTNVNKFIYKQIWKGVNVERWAVTAEEISHHKPGQSRARHFAWLCLHEQRLAS